MLVICEDCAKKYNIDESKIQGKRARFICKECGHIIIVDKPETSGTPVSSSGTATGGSTIDLFKEMQGATNPYVREKKSEPSAATASRQTREEPEPEPSEPSAATAPQQIREEQKPPPEQEQAPEREPPPNQNAGGKEKDGGLPVSMHFVFALFYTIISTIGVLVYLGSFANVLNLDLPNVIVTSLSLVGVVAVVGIVIFLFLSRLIAQPLGELTDAANRINDGGLDFPIISGGPREVRELATALERVRISCRR